MALYDHAHRVTDQEDVSARLVEQPREPVRCDACDAPLEGEPAGRGELPQVSVTVANATNSPAARHPAADKLTVWQYRDHAAIDRAQRLLAEFSEARSVDMAMLTVALRELRNLG